MNQQFDFSVGLSGSVSVSWLRREARSKSTTDCLPESSRVLAVEFAIVNPNRTCAVQNPRENG